MEPASFTLPVKMKLKTKVSTLPVILQLIALAMDRGWESRMRTNIGASTLQIEAHTFLLADLTFSHSALDRVGERPGKSHRERPRIGLEFLLAFRPGSHISDGDLDHERAAANVLLTPADPGANMVLVERLQLYGDALAHDPPLSQHEAAGRIE
jgi:hypothetical protein